MLRFGFDAKRFFNNYTGLGNYSRDILKNLSSVYPENEYYLYSSKIPSNKKVIEYINSGKYHLIEPKTQFRALWRSFGIKKNLIKDKIDLYHGLSFELPFGIRKTKIKTVVTIHDLIFLKYPELYPLVDRTIYDIKCRYAALNADIITTISEASKKDIVKYYNINPEKIKVVYPPCGENFIVPKGYEDLAALISKFNLPSSYILYVGSVIRRKNLLNIVEAFKYLPHDLKIPLVIVGKADNAYKQNIIEYIRQNQLEKYVIWLENVSNNDLPALYQKSTLFTYPSRYEGFGIPVLEALFSKVPVITSKLSSLPEAGGPNSYYIDPESPEEIASGIYKILTDQTMVNKMVTKGYEYALNFTGEAIAKKMMEVYKSPIVS
jgi:glycosyltransferase involved in cell wall biosynthesis